MDAPRFERILVPIDFTSGCEEALAFAVALGRPHSAELLLVHVMEAVVYPAGTFAEQAFAVDVRRMRSDLEAALRKMSEEQQAKHGLRMRFQLRIGRAWEEIVLEAALSDSDLIVIASGGHSAATYAILGSTVERVAHRAPCPVLIARPKRQEWGSATRSRSARRIEPCSSATS